MAIGKDANENTKTTYIVTGPEIENMSYLHIKFDLIFGLQSLFPNI